MTSRPGPQPSRPLRALAAASLALLLLHAANHAASERDALASLAESAVEPPALAVHRALGDLAPLVPPDGRVLLVAGNETPRAWDFQLQPRPLHVLMPLNPALVELTRRHDPVAGERLAWWHEQVRERDQALDAASLRRHLAGAQWLLLVECEAAALPWPADGPRRTELARDGPATLLRLEHGP